MKGDTDKHEIIGNMGNKGNHFRTIVEPNLNGYFNELINFSGPFATIILTENWIFFTR